MDTDAWFKILVTIGTAVCCIVVVVSAVYFQHYAQVGLEDDKKKILIMIAWGAIVMTGIGFLIMLFLFIGFDPTGLVGMALERAEELAESRF